MARVSVAGLREAWARRRRPLRALQVEVTSRCTRRCRLCPRGQLAGRWVDRDLETSSWRAVAPALPLTQHVHLQGWGEPLLHPALSEMVAQAHAAGCTVGLTTNGDLLGAAAPWLVELDVDLVVVSVAGASTANPSWRDAQRAEKVLAVAGELAARVGRRARLRVKVSYLLTRDNAGELEETVAEVARQRLDELFVVHLDCTPTPDLLQRAAFGPGGLAPGVAAALQRAGELSRRLKVRFRPPAVEPSDPLVCSLDPTRFAFVASDGRVGPCVNALLPIRGNLPRWTADGPLDVPATWYGSVAEASLVEVLSGPARRRFVTPFVARLAAEADFRRNAVDGFEARSLGRLEDADRRRVVQLEAHPFPAECRGCHLESGW